MNTDCNWCYIYRGNKAEKCEECGKRLSPTGSGAMTCCGGREAGDQQDSAEEEGAQRLNREDWRVAPGEAEAALLFAIKRLAELEKISRDAAKERWNSGWIPESRRFREDANAYRSSIKILKSLLPKPDSEARNERSGRRNATMEARPDGTPQ